MSQQKYPKAYEAYQQAVYRDGRNPTFWCSIGVLYYQINQYRDALDAYSRAIRLNPYISEVWYDLGTLVSLIVPEDPLYLRICADQNYSMSRAIIRSTMLWMHTSALPNLIQPTSISRLVYNYFATDRRTGCLPAMPHLFRKMCTRMPISQAAQSDHQDHNGEPQHNNKLVLQALLQEPLQLATGVTTDSLISIRRISHQDNLMSVMATADHNNHRHASQVRDKSIRCVLTLSLLATMVQAQHIAVHLLHVIIMLCQDHMQVSHKGHHHRLHSKLSCKLLVLPAALNV